jgi:hypothetical protein
LGEKFAPLVLGSEQGDHLVDLCKRLASPLVYL